MLPTPPERPPNTPADPSGSLDPTPTPVIDIIACDGVDTSPVVVAAHGLSADVRVFNSPEPWFEQLATSERVDAPPPADVAALVAGAERMATQRWIARANAAAMNTRLLAAIVDASLEQVTNVVNQGAAGLVVLPTSAEQLTRQLSEVVAPAARTQSRRREAAHHRRALNTLAPGEHEVLVGMLEGLANKQIAQRLSIGLRTVELRRSKIMKKMAARNLAQLVKHVCTAEQGFR